MSWRRVVLASAASAAVAACAIVERRVEPLDDAGGNPGSTGPAEAGGATSSGGRRGSGGAGRGGSSAGGGHDASVDASADAEGAPGGGTSSGGATASGGARATGGATASGGSKATTWDGAAPSCRNQPGLGSVLLCDDFEAVDLHPQWAHFVTTGDDGHTNLVFNAFPHRGERGLISVKSAQGPRDPLFADVLGGRTTGHLYLRAWMHFPSTARIVDHPEANATLFVLGESAAPHRGCGVAIWRSGLTAQCSGVQAGSFAITANTLPFDAWVCVRFDFPIGQNVPAAQYRIRLNGTTLTNAVSTPTTSALNTGYTRLWLGVNHISEFQTSDVVVYYDDVAVDARDIACE